MSILDQLIGVFAPHNCINCKTEGALLCQHCVQGLQTIPSRCYRCRKITERSQTCTACRKTSRLYRVQVGTIYTQHAKRMIWQLKYAGAQATASEIAMFLSEKSSFEPDSVIVHVPTATSRVRQRGYDQAKLLARYLAKQTGLPYLNCLSRSGQTHQIGARREQRLKQLATAYRIKPLKAVNDLNIVLVDDVVTTGASLEAAATCLKKAGAKRVEAIVFAQA